LRDNEEIADEKETIEFIVDFNKSTVNSKFIVRKRTVVTESNSATKTEVFEDTFTIPLHKFNMNLILSQAKVINVDETIIIMRKVVNTLDSTEIDILTDVNLETLLPTIDHNEISHIKIIESRRHIVKKKVSTFLINI